MRKIIGMKNILSGITAVFCMVTVLGLSACVPTYPKEKLPEAIRTVCDVEYGMKVEVEVVGRTICIYYPMKDLLDAGMGISEGAWDKISNLILIASRVVLSTDADINFYCVITQDERLPEFQVVIIKYVEDVKRGMYQNISRGESFKRTLFSINLTPQAKKERSIDTVFNRLGVEEETRQKVMDEFFRSPPVRLSDIGYWRGKFYVKDIPLPEFLAAQIANRMKIDFRSDEKLKEMFDYKASEGLFFSDEEKSFFLLKFKIFGRSTEESPVLLREKKIHKVLDIASKVLYGYKFTDFGFLEMEDQLENAKLRVDVENVYNFNKKKLAVKEVVQAPGGYF